MEGERVRREQGFPRDPSRGANCASGSRIVPSVMNAITSISDFRKARISCILRLDEHCFSFAAHNELCYDEVALMDCVHGRAHQISPGVFYTTE